MREIKSEQITDVIRDLCIEANCHLPQDIRDAMAECRRRESFAIAENILEKLEDAVCSSNGVYNIAGLIQIYRALKRRSTSLHHSQKNFHSNIVSAYERLTSLLS